MRIYLGFSSPLLCLPISGNLALGSHKEKKKEVGERKEWEEEMEQGEEREVYTQLHWVGTLPSDHGALAVGKGLICLLQPVTSKMF